MAKALGVPVAMLAASSSFIDSFIEQSDTWVHCSPPSIAHLKAAAVRCAQSRRGRPASLPSAGECPRLRREMRDAGLPVRGGIFPLQRLVMPSLAAAAKMERGLADRGVQTVVARTRCRDEAAVTFIITQGMTTRRHAGGNRHQGCHARLHGNESVCEPVTGGIAMKPQRSFLPGAEMRLPPVPPPRPRARAGVARVDHVVRAPGSFAPGDARTSRVRLALVGAGRSRWRLGRCRAGTAGRRTG